MMRLQNETHARPGHIYDMVSPPTVLQQVDDVGKIYLEPGRPVRDRPLKEDEKNLRHMSMDVYERLSAFKIVSVTVPNHDMRFTAPEEKEEYAKHRQSSAGQQIGRFIAHSGLIETRPDTVDDEFTELRRDKRKDGDPPQYHDSVFMERSEVVVISKKDYYEFVAAMRRLVAATP